MWIMDVYWILRIVLIIFFYLLIILFGYFIKYRKKYTGILENRIINILLVIAYNALCYVPVILPENISQVRYISGFLSHPFVSSWYIISGLFLICAGVMLLIITLRKRKAIGGEDTKGKLLTSGIYRIARHPVYAGIIIITTGLVFSFKNAAGFILLPFIIGANILEAKFEENYDMEIRFKNDYAGYKKKTLLFGPLWFWGIIAAIACFPLVYIQLL
jgi:protein-S-isoprenylcysteine O-methyltransferase Ste14